MDSFRSNALLIWTWSSFPTHHTIHIHRSSQSVGTTLNALYHIDEQTLWNQRVFTKLQTNMFTLTTLCKTSPKKVTFCKKPASHWPQESMFKHVGNHLIFIKSLKKWSSENAQSDRIKQSLKRYYPSKSSSHFHCHSLWYTLPGTSAP